MKVEILLDSLNPYTGTRLTTFYLLYPQNCHQHVLTHRVFSRNAMSLRAISTTRVSDFELSYPTWTVEKKGMQGDLADPSTSKAANILLEEMYKVNLTYAKALSTLGIHHQNINDYLRPYTDIHVILSATDLDNFFKLRLAKNTKPDTRILAEKMKAALEESKPFFRVEHIPLSYTFDTYGLSQEEVSLICAARLARYSYMKWSDDITKDIALARKLIEDKHASPFEHIATATPDNNYYANFRSWKQLRKVLEL